MIILKNISLSRALSLSLVRWLIECRPYRGCMPARWAGLAHMLMSWPYGTSCGFLTMEFGLEQVPASSLGRLFPNQKIVWAFSCYFATFLSSVAVPIPSRNGGGHSSPDPAPAQAARPAQHPTRHRGTTRGRSPTPLRRSEVRLPYQHALSLLHS